MKYFSNIVLIVFLFNFTMCKGQFLDQHQWKDRVILVFSPDLQSNDFKKQMELFEQEDAEVKDRNLVIYQLSPQKGINPKGELIDSSDLTALYQSYNVSAKAFAVILIGKDGGRKFTAEELTEPEKLFRLIDSMPMRRAEMRRKKGNH